jgi:hypothetical protein
MCLINVTVRAGWNIDVRCAEGDVGVESDHEMANVLNPLKKR